METNRVLNYRPSPVDTRDHTFKLIKNTVALPSSIDLTSNCTTVKDQGSIGSCTAFATVAAMEYLEKKFNSNPNSNYSEMFTYYATRVNVEGWPASQDTGAYIRSAVKSTVTYGTCLETVWPYSNPFYRQPPTSVYNEAKKYKSISYVSTSPTNLSAIKTMLSVEVPVIIGFTCYSNLFDDSVSETGIILPSNGQIIGGHAVLAVGYDDATGYIKFKNSWGTNWAIGGYGFMPYDYFTANVSEAWSILTENNNGRLIATNNVTITNNALLNPQITAVLNDVVSNIDTAMNKSRYVSYFTSLAAQYPNNTKIINLINNLRNSFLTINQ